MNKHNLKKNLGKFEHYLASFEDTEPSTLKNYLINRELGLKHVVSWTNVFFAGTSIDEYTNEAQPIRRLWDGNWRVLRNQFNGYLILAKNGIGIIGTSDNLYNPHTWLRNFLSGVGFAFLDGILQALLFHNDNNTDSNDDNPYANSGLTRVYTGHNLFIPKSQIVDITYDEQENYFWRKHFYIDLKDGSNIEIKAYPCEIRMWDILKMWNDLGYETHDITPIHDAKTDKTWHDFQKEQKHQKRLHQFENTKNTVKTLPQSYKNKLQRLKAKHQWHQMQKIDTKDNKITFHENLKNKTKHLSSKYAWIEVKHQSNQNNITFMQDIKRWENRLSNKWTWFKMRHHL